MIDKLEIIIAIVVVLILACTVAANLNSAEETTITVDDKWTKYKAGQDKYLVSDMDGNVYEIGDSALFLKFDASGRYAKIDTGKTYDVKMVGWRIPIISSYQNIIELAEV
ncbi:hypothetical protein GQ473_02060 [archaeon]|nr:hypothetical protein [archaeon]